MSFPVIDPESLAKGHATLNSILNPKAPAPVTPKSAAVNSVADSALKRKRNEVDTPSDSKQRKVSSTTQSTSSKSSTSIASSSASSSSSSSASSSSSSSASSSSSSSASSSAGSIDLNMADNPDLILINKGLEYASACFDHKKTKTGLQAIENLIKDFASFTSYKESIKVLMEYKLYNATLFLIKKGFQKLPADKEFYQFLIETTTSIHSQTKDKTGVEAETLKSQIETAYKSNKSNFISKCRQSLEQDPNNTKFHENLIITLQEFGDFQEAANAAKTLFQLDNKNLTALSTLSRHYFKTEDYTNAIRYADLFLKEQPNHASIHYRMALSHLKLGYGKRALEELEKIIDKAPDFTEAYGLKCTLLLKQDTFENPNKYSMALETIIKCPIEIIDNKPKNHYFDEILSEWKKESSNEDDSVYDPDSGSFSKSTEKYQYDLDPDLFSAKVHLAKKDYKTALFFVKSVGWPLFGEVPDNDYAEAEKLREQIKAEMGDAYYAMHANPDEVELY